MGQIGERIKYARERNGKLWTQTYTAKMAGVSAGTIGMLESGKRGISGSIPGTIPAIAKALGVNYDWLAYGTGEMAVGATLVSNQNIDRRAISLSKLLLAIPESKRDAAYQAVTELLIDALHSDIPVKAASTPMASVPVKRTGARKPSLSV
jgi:transcriptional regulator with XRE-family HTH domain